MANKVRNYVIAAAGSLMLVCFTAGAGFAWHPGNNGCGNNDRARGMMMHRGGPQCDKYLVDNGVPTATVNAYVADKNKFRTESGAAFEAMRAKNLELYAEMLKDAPNADKAKALQAELSKMRADFDAKRLEHELYIKTTYPKICEIMQQNYQNKGFGPGKPGSGFHHNGPGFGGNHQPGFRN